MSAGSAFFIFLIILIIFSIVFNFWIWLVVGALIIIGIIVAVSVGERNQERSTWRRVRPRNTHSTPKDVFRRDLRKRIDDEWKNQTGFGNAEDLR